MEEQMLPKEPSALIRLGLKDLKQVEEDKGRYVVNMGEWHIPEASGLRCEVCLAGAVLAKTIGESPNKYVVPSPGRHGADAAKLEALNFFRQGLVHHAVWKMGLMDDADRLLGEDPGFAHREVPDYDPDAPDAFHAAMGEMADELEMHGL